MMKIKQVLFLCSFCFMFFDATASNRDALRVGRFEENALAKTSQIKLKRSKNKDAHVENARLLGTTGWVDEGLNTLYSDPDYIDPVTGLRGLHRFLDSRPFLSASTGAGTTQHPLSVLVLFVDFDDRRIEDAGEKFRTFRDYINLIEPAAEWIKASSYQRLQLQFVAPQEERKLGWLRLRKHAAEYVVNRDEAQRYAYVREIAQLAYDQYDIRVDDYDTILLMPAKGEKGFPNGPATISAQYVGESNHNARFVYVDKGGKQHTQSHFITAGNDLYYWGPLWFVHEFGHVLGIPDAYLYDTKVLGQSVKNFFYIGGWDVMGKIRGISPDFFGWHKWKMGWLGDKQVDVLSAETDLSNTPSKYMLHPVETAGGKKLLVLPVNFHTAYVAEYRTGMGVNQIDQTSAKNQGVLIYRIDTQLWASADQPVVQVISKAYYQSAAVGGAANRTGVWRPVDSGLDGYGENALWQPGDEFVDDKTGVHIKVESIQHSDMGNEIASSVNADSIVTIHASNPASATKIGQRILNACLREDGGLTFTMAHAPREFVRQPGDGLEGPVSTSQEVPKTRITKSEIVLQAMNGGTIEAAYLSEPVIAGNTVHIKIDTHVLASKTMSRGLLLSTKGWGNFTGAAAVNLSRCRASSNID